MTAFFTGKREQFFRPLTHADRECCAAVLRSLYDRIQGPNADYSEALTREVVLTAHAEQARESARVAHSAKYRGQEQDDGTDLAESVTPGND